MLDQKERYLFSAGWFVTTCLRIVLVFTGLIFVIKWVADFCRAYAGLSMMVMP